MSFYQALQTLLSKMEPERSHDLVLNALGIVSRSAMLSTLCGKIIGHPGLSSPVEVMGLQFRHPIGLAAGLDKKGRCLRIFDHLGFAFTEHGTVVPRPQPGNPEPRMYRLKDQQAIINRMGFNSDGLDTFVKNIARQNSRGIVGINIGKNAATPLGKAIDDYLLGLGRCYALADYICINISSPNTENLRALQADDSLAALLKALNAKRQQLCEQFQRRVPLVVKIAPDLSRTQIDAICQHLRACEIDGVCATNTTVERKGIEHLSVSGEVGGLSGSPLSELSTRIIHTLHQNLQGEIPIIGAGGILSAQDAVEKIQAGAQLLQLYTGLIYQGPALIRDCVTAHRRLRQASPPEH